jgi:hypothetical protein
VNPRLRSTAGRGLRLVLLGGTAAALLGVAVWAAAGTHLLALHPCQNNADPLGRPTSTLFILGAVGTFVLGHVLGLHRDFCHEEHLLPLAGAPIEHRPRGDRTALLLHAALSLFLLLVVAMLAYETWAFWLPDPSPRWPITSFVRCADRTHTIPTLGAVWLASFLAGHWLWHPLRTREA